MLEIEDGISSVEFAKCSLHLPSMRMRLADERIAWAMIVVRRIAAGMVDVDVLLVLCFSHYTNPLACTAKVSVFNATL